MNFPIASLIIQLQFEPMSEFACYKSHWFWSMSYMGNISTLWLKKLCLFIFGKEEALNFQSLVIFWNGRLTYYWLDGWRTWRRFSMVILSLMMLLCSQNLNMMSFQMWYGGKLLMYRCFLDMNLSWQQLSYLILVEIKFSYVLLHTLKQHYQ